MFKFLLGFAFGAILVYNVNVDEIFENVEFEKKEVEISVPVIK